MGKHILDMSDDANEMEAFQEDLENADVEIEEFDDVKPTRSKKGLGMISVGLLLITAALLIVLYNRIDDYLAGQDSKYYEEMLVDRMKDYVPEPEEEGNPFLEDETKEMPTIIMDGNEYIGILIVPEYNLSLPVMKDWDYTKLKTAPCRFTGSYFTNDLVICGHNYPSHFSNMKWIPLGSEIDFLAVDGTVYVYEVANIEIVDGNDMAGMISDPEETWDMTLFTCTTGGRARSAVRCTQISGAKTSYYETHMKEVEDETGAAAE